MTLKSVSRVARVVGFVVSPLLTAPAAGGDLERGALALFARSEIPVAPRDRQPASAAPEDVRRGRRVSL